MKTLLPFLLIFSLTASSQITTSILKANFGVDADLRANIWVNPSTGFNQTGNDDWYNQIGTVGTGAYVIDTTGAAALLAAYASDASPWTKRMSSVFRSMSKPSFSIVNNRLWLDALFVRDYHGTDTTVFTSGSDKNGMSPVNWTGGTQGIPDKNDILDIFMHVRRAGPNTTDSLWMFGGISLDNTTGNRYFDFEMYQTDINYDRASGKWFGYGADAGHTSWQFDAAGNITRPGDIIFSAEYQSSTLSNIEARIWINKNDLSKTPTGFTWSGQFDGASSGAQYGYASILPKNGGTFYTGLGSAANTWTGPFQLVLQNNTVVSNYAKDQFMEFSVNLTKLGLDPVTTFGTDVCGTPFNRLVVKTRASSSFTAELKDFVAPTDLFLAPRVDARADVPVFCKVITVSNLQVQNPSASSVYTWSTTDGHIVGTTSGTAITVDAPGTYVVTQRLSAACNPYAYDTVNVIYDASCSILASRLTGFRGLVKNKTAALSWGTKANLETEYFEVERSFNGRDFVAAGKVMATPPNPEQNYSFEDNLVNLRTDVLYYRLKIRAATGAVSYSSVVRLRLEMDEKDVIVYPNPVNEVLQLSIPSSRRQETTISVFDMTGSLLKREKFPLNDGINVVQIDVNTFKAGTYMVHTATGNESVWKKFIVSSTLVRQ